MKKNFLNTDLIGKTIVFTGGTDGMGKSAVTKLANMGATIMLLGRNEAKTNSEVAELNTISERKNAYYVHCDLASQDSVRQAATVVLDRCTTIDLLINCAGANVGTRQISKDGFEMNWAINHLGPFLLTQLLLERVKSTPNSKIVNLSSATSGWIKMNYEDLQLTKSWSLLKSYGQAKLAMIMCTRKMAKELEGTGTAINSLNPGFIKSNLLNNGIKGWNRIIGTTYMFLCASKTEVGGDRILRLALSKDFEGVTGKFIYEDAERDPNPEALNDEMVERIWEISKEQVQLQNSNA